MTYDGIILAAVISELGRVLAGARVQKIRQHSDTDVTIELRGMGHTYLLFLSANARFSRLHLTAGAPPVPEHAPQFCMVLRKHLEGAFLARVEQVGLDRIANLVFRHRGAEEVALIVEIMGKHSNLILIDSTGKILGAAKHIGISVSRTRQILPGREYMAPPGAQKIDVRSIDSAVFDTLWKAKPEEEKTRDWLVRTFSGFGPFVADEMCARAKEPLPEPLRDELLDLAETLRASAFEPVLITNERGEDVMAYPLPSVQYPASQQHARPSINEALDALFRGLTTRTALDDARAQVLTAIRRAAAGKRQTLKSIERTAAESERADGYRQTGELLMAALHQIEKGAKSARLVNYFDPEMPEIEVELDEKLSPLENAQRYFKRYQKARDSADTVRARRAQTQKDIDLLAAAEMDAGSARDVETLTILRKALTDQGLLRTQVAQAAQAEEFGGQRIRRVETADGWEILYGENSRANDHLTTHVARPSDIWLHARSVTGAHVVIRTAGHAGPVPRKVLIQAALIAAQNSEAKHSSLVPVDHTLRKYVRKPRGSAPGFVTYRNEKTLDITP